LPPAEVQIAPKAWTEWRFNRLSVGLGLSLILHGVLFNLAPGQPGGSRGDGESSPSAPAFTIYLPQEKPETENLIPAKGEVSTEPLPQEKTSAAMAHAQGATGTNPTDIVAKTADQATVVNGLIVGPWYYPARYLHRHPSPLKPIWPDYPASAQDLSGRVTILLLINEEGKVDQYRIQEAAPDGVFEPAVIRAFTEARYAPGMIAGMAVKSQLLAEVSFTPGAPPRMQLLPGAALP